MNELTIACCQKLKFGFHFTICLANMLLIAKSRENFRSEPTFDPLSLEMAAEMNHISTR